MDIVVILVALLLVALVGWMAYRKVQRDEAEFNRRFTFDDEGIEPPHNLPFQFQGEGAQTTRPLTLAAGDYRIRYHVPDGVLVKLELLGAGGENGALILLQGGRGEAGFTVEVEGRYLLDIEPDEEGAAWKLEISRLGLPSGDSPESL